MQSEIKHHEHSPKGEHSIVVFHLLLRSQNLVGGKWYGTKQVDCLKIGESSISSRLTERTFARSSGQRKLRQGSNGSA